MHIDMSQAIFPIIAILEQIESEGNVMAIGDNGRAFGILQIQQDCLTDVNRANGTKYKLQDMLGEKGKELSEWVFMEYMKLYAREERLGHPPTFLDMARIWNGGPNGWKRATTLPYQDRFVSQAHKQGFTSKDYA